MWDKQLGYQDLCVARGEGNSLEEPRVKLYSPGIKAEGV